MAPPGLVLPAVHPPLNTCIHCTLQLWTFSKWTTCVVHACFRCCASLRTLEVGKSMHYAELNKVSLPFHLCLKGDRTKGRIWGAKPNKQLLLGAIAGLCNCIIERLDSRTSRVYVCACGLVCTDACKSLRSAWQASG